MALSVRFHKKDAGVEEHSFRVYENGWKTVSGLGPALDIRLYPKPETLNPKP